MSPDGVRIGMLRADWPGEGRIAVVASKPGMQTSSRPQLKVAGAGLCTVEVVPMRWAPLLVTCVGRKRVRSLVRPAGDMAGQEESQLGRLFCLVPRTSAPVHPALVAGMNGWSAVAGCGTVGAAARGWA
jgi:hypothetical protein